MCIFLIIITMHYNNYRQASYFDTTKVWVLLTHPSLLANMYRSGTGRLKPASTRSVSRPVTLCIHPQMSAAFGMVAERQTSLWI